MTNRLLGAIVGDVSGSYYEGYRTKSYNAVDLLEENNNFTDDTVCTCAIADALTDPTTLGTYDFTNYLKHWVREYPDAGYGSSFKEWCFSEENTINTSYGNGSAMRVSSIGYFANNITECRILAQESAYNSHAHVEGIKGAQAIAEAVFICRDYLNDYHKYSNKLFVTNTINSILNLYYPEWLDTDLDYIKEKYSFEVSCQNSVPVALMCVRESTSYEDCLKKAISMGGDADTLAAMAGSVAYPIYGSMSSTLQEFVLSKLDDRIIYTIDQFDNFIDEKFGYNKHNINSIN